MYGSVENEQGLRDAAQLQAMTKQKLDGIERTLVETDDVAANTEQELKKQTEQIREVDEQMGVLHGALDRSRQLLNTFDRWAFRRANDTEVQAEAAKILQDAELSPLEQQTLFEHQRFDPITRQWKDPFMPRDPGPFVYLDGKPAVESLGASRWKIDFDEPDIDDEGWSYGFDFGNLRSGSRSSKRQWNHFVRRRKWKYQREERSDIVDTMSARYKTGTARPAGLASLAATAEEQNATATTVPGLRVKVASRLPNDPSLTRTLMGRGPRGVDISNSAGGYDSLTAHEKEQLSQIEQGDKEIDSAIGNISSLVDRLEARARTMNEEVRAQNSSVAVMESKMDSASSKLAQVQHGTAREEFAYLGYAATFNLHQPDDMYSLFCRGRTRS